MSRSWSFAKSKSTIASDKVWKAKIPGGVPGILPFVRHGDDIGVEHVEPFHVSRAALQRRAADDILCSLNHCSRSKK